MNPSDKQRLDKLEKLVNTLLRVENLDFIANLERRLDLTDCAKVSNSLKTLDSEDISINESGSATKTALDDPDGWIKLGANKNVPVYND